MVKFVTAFIYAKTFLKRGQLVFFFLYIAKGHKIISLNYRNYTCTNVLKSQVTELFQLVFSILNSVLCLTAN